MVRRWLAVCALAVLGTAQAAVPDPPTCYPWDSNAKEAEVLLVPTNPVVWLSVQKEVASFTITWWCRDKYQWRPFAVYGYRADLDQEWADTLQMLRSMQRGELDALWQKGVACDGDPSNVNCAKYKGLISNVSQQVAATRPPPIIWAVKDNPSRSDRPVYRANNGVRNPTPITNERVSDVATLCDCVANALEESGGTYCSVAGRPNTLTGSSIPATLGSDRVTLCEERNRL